MKKTVLALSLLVGLSAAASSYAALPQTVRIGTDATYAPFSSKDAKGDFVGFDIDLGNEMCKRMEVKCTWVGSDFDALIPSLKAKKIDAIISSLSITEKRQQEIAFSEALRCRLTSDCRERLANPADHRLAERQTCWRASGFDPGRLRQC